MASYDDTATVSGSVVSIDNGADDVPTKSLVVTIPPTLSGVSSVSETQTGRNLFNVADYSQIYTDRDGVDSYNYRYMIIHLKPNTTYTVSQNSGEYSVTPIILINNALPVGGANYFDLRKASDTKTYTTDSTGRLYIGSVNSYDDVAYERLQACKVQIEVGSTASTFEPYSGTTHTANLGRTIYGGEVDIVNGKCEPINWLPNIATSKTQNGITWTVNADGTVTLEGTSTARTYLYIHIYFKILPHDATITVNVEGLYDNGASDVFVNIPYSDNGTTYSGSYGQCTWANPTKQIDYTADKYIGFYIDCPSGVTTNQTVKITVSIGTTAHTYSPYFEPFTFTGQEIPTRLGNNTMWSEQGNIELTYYKSGYGFTSVTVHKETPRGEPVEETRKLHRIIYEGQVDVIDGTGLIYRGESGTQYDPPEQISFTPIEVSTDEGENTLYADQGDSAITYRKAVD